MKPMLVVFLLISGLVACNAHESREPDEGSAIGLPPATSGAEHEVNIGDVEAQVRILGTLAPQSEADNVQVQVYEHGPVIDMATVTVNPPYPTELNVVFTTRALRDFPVTPVVVRAKVLVDKREIGSYATKFGVRATFEEREDVVDVLAGLDTIPESMLVHVEAEAVLMPQGTDEASVDPLTATASVERRTVIRSNPVRINFVGGQEAP